jgi:pyruvate dehydrogenase E2 component (dihydrolipoamide acetyltransferase)
MEETRGEMAVPIKLPDMGTNVEECKVLSWRVKEGEQVKRGDILAEIETDKAVAELESTAEGTVLRCLVQAGEMAHTGDILAYVGKQGDAIPASLLTPQQPPPNQPPPRTAHSVFDPASETKGAIHVSPMVKNLATKMGVDLSTVRGTGSGGIITREDVLRLRPPNDRPQAAPVGDPLSRAQAAVARAVLQSWKEIPHLYITAAIDMFEVLRIQTQSSTSGAKLGYDAIFLKAMASAIETMPLVAARLAGQVIVRPRGIHIALAMDLENELLLPVIRDVNQKKLPALQSEISELAQQIQAHTLKAERLTGGCMALSNLGMYPIEEFQAIIFPEHSMILGVGAVESKPRVIHDRVEIRPMATVRLAADHRLINGRAAARFLTKIKEIVESGNIL